MKDFEFLQEARDRYRKGSDAWRANKESWLEDVRFGMLGQQWSERDKEDRKGRPSLTFNRLPSFMAQVIGDARQNKPSIKVSAADSVADPDTAEVLDGLVRHIQQHSKADEAYDIGLEHSVAGGFGYLRVITDYAEGDTFEQDILIRPIENPMTVTLDPSARLPCKEDMKWAMINQWQSKDEFKAQYPNARYVDWDSDDLGEGMEGWFEEDRIRKCEYFYKIPTSKRLGMLSDGTTIELTDQPLPPGITVKRQRKVNCDQVKRCLMTGMEVLERNDWAGKFIPIVPVFGPGINIDGEWHYRSLIRFAKDPQRMYNYWQSAIAEKIGLAPKAPFIGTIRQFQGLESKWINANAENYAYLPYNPDPEAPSPPKRQEPAPVNTAEIQQAAQAVEDLKATTGIYDASLGNRSNETSGVAITARQREGDNATFVWIDNLARAIRQVGVILVDLIPKIYDTERLVRILGEDGTEEQVMVNQLTYDVEAGQFRTVYDLTVGKYDVIVTVGPSYATQRQESADFWLRFMQAVPQAGMAIADIVAKNLDIKDADEVTKRIRRMQPPGLIDPDPNEPPPPEQPPDPMQELSLAKAQADVEGVQLDNAGKAMELGVKEAQANALAQGQPVMMEQ